MACGQDVRAPGPRHFIFNEKPRPLYNTYARLAFTVEHPADIKAARVVQQNCHQYLRNEVYLNGYRVAAILRPNTCELAPEALQLLRQGTNTLAIYLTSCRGTSMTSTSASMLLGNNGGPSS